MNRSIVFSFVVCEIARRTTFIPFLSIKEGSGFGNAVCVPMCVCGFVARLVPCWTQIDRMDKREEDIEYIEGDVGKFYGLG